MYAVLISYSQYQNEFHYVFYSFYFLTNIKYSLLLLLLLLLLYNKTQNASMSALERDILIEFHFQDYKSLPLQTIATHSFPTVDA